MNSKIKAVVGTVAVATVLNFTAVGQAVAVWCAADAAIIYADIVGKFAPFLKDLIEVTGQGTEGAVIQVGAATRAEVLKSAMANKAVEEGLEAYRQQEDLRNKALDLQASMEQPASTCQAMATSTSLSTAAQNAQARVFSTQAKAMRSIATNTSTVQALDTAHQASNTNFCSPEEAASGVCTVNRSARYANLAGADHDAMFLFQAKDGSSSYEGVDNGAQAEAADAYIARVMAGIPPEQLRDRGEDYYRRNPQARAYAELQRRYNAMLSMGVYSLSQIKEMHRTQAGLGRDTMMATVSVGGFAPNKNDMSMSEVVERFVATKFSPDSVKDLAKATQPNVILRDMAQMNSFQLWMSYQQMLQSSRTEGLMAHQLALMAEQTLRPQIDAQRVAAARAAGVAP